MARPDFSILDDTIPSRVSLLKERLRHIGSFSWVRKGLKVLAYLVVFFLPLLLFPLISRQWFARSWSLILSVFAVVMVAVALLLRVRWWVALISVALCCPFGVVVFVTTLGYTKGHAAIHRTDSGLNHGDYRIDRKTRATIWGGGCVRSPYDWVVQMPRNITTRVLVSVFGYAKDSYAGPYPKKSEALGALSTLEAVPTQQFLDGAVHFRGRALQLPKELALHLLTGHRHRFVYSQEYNASKHPMAVQVGLLKGVLLVRVRSLYNAYHDGPLDKLVMLAPMWKKPFSFNLILVKYSLERQKLPPPGLRRPPKRAEICNGLDDDGDGKVDEGLQGVGKRCFVERNGCRYRGTLRCNGSRRKLECSALMMVTMEGLLFRLRSPNALYLRAYYDNGESKRVRRVWRARAKGGEWMCLKPKVNSTVSFGARGYVSCRLPYKGGPLRSIELSFLRIDQSLLLPRDDYCYRRPSP